MFEFSRTALLAAAALFVTVAPGQAASDDLKPMIRMTGVGEVQATPDTVLFQTGVVTEAATAKAALDANSGQMTNVIDGLKALGIAARDLRTANFSIDPKYSRNKSTGVSRIEGFEVRNTVSIIIRDVRQVGDIVDRAASLGANQFGGLQFLVKGADAKLDAARTDAIKDARRKAEIYALAAGAELGAVVSIVEGRDSDAPRPVMARREMMAESAPAPIEAGETTLSVQVTVVWELESQDD